MSLNIAILYGSLRRDRQGIKAAWFIRDGLERRGHKVTVVDAMELQLPLLDRMYKEYPKAETPAVLARLAEKFEASDGFVAVSGEYNHGIPPGLKNLLDHFLEEWFYRPSGVVCYSTGMFGGVRAAMQLRMTLAELGMPSIPTLLPIPRVQDVFDTDGTPVSPLLDRRAAAFLDEFEWYAEALREQRAKGLPGVDR